LENTSSKAEEKERVEPKRGSRAPEGVDRKGGKHESQSKAKRVQKPKSGEHEPQERRRRIQSEKHESQGMKNERGEHGPQRKLEGEL